MPINSWRRFKRVNGRCQPGSLIKSETRKTSEPGWQRPLTLLNRRHELIGIRLWDPREVELPNAGLIVVQDAETGEQLYVDTGNPEFRRRFVEAAERREATLKQDLNHAGVDLYGVSTDEDLVGAIVRMAILRKKRKR